MKGFHLRFYRFYAILGIYTKHELKEGVRRGDYRSKPRREAADSQRLRPAISGKGLQTHNRRRNSESRQRLGQYVSEYLPHKRRRVH